jgi:ADP-ribose pyrophosphatase YjhB (NUDIX family)
MSGLHSGQNNYFRSTKERPFHISVGAVIFNDKGELLCRHFTNYQGRPMDIYILPTETLEQNETLEQALHRGIHEEVGAKADIKGFLGPLVGFAINGDKVFEKTVLFFLMQVKEVYTPLYPDEDGTSTIEWHTPEFLLDQIQYMPEDIIHSVLNESTIIKNAQRALESLTVKI